MTYIDILIYVCFISVPICWWQARKNIIKMDRYSHRATVYNQLDDDSEFLSIWSE